MATWKELDVRSVKGLTIDKQEMELAEAERNRWWMFSQLLAIIHSLAERNMALRGYTCTLNKPDNEVELMAKCDPVMKEHIVRVENAASSQSISLWMRSNNEIFLYYSSPVFG